MLIENVHARRMASEAFYCQGAGRTSTNEPAPMTRSLTCCAARPRLRRQWFNNNDVSENIYMLQCRVDGVGWHAYEGPARLHPPARTTTCATPAPSPSATMSHRSVDLNKLGCGQAIVAGNVFEGIGRSRGHHRSIMGRRGRHFRQSVHQHTTAPPSPPAATPSHSYPSKNITIANNQST